MSFFNHLYFWFFGTYFASIVPMMHKRRFFKIILFNLALFVGSFLIVEAMAELIPGMGTATVNNVGVQLHSDFSETGGYTIQLQVNPGEGSVTDTFLDQFKAAIDSVDCSVANPTSLCCLCDHTEVVKGSSGALDVAIDIDSSGSNAEDYDEDGKHYVASDPGNLRLTAAQQVVESLLTGDNHVAAFNFGTRYCSLPKTCDNTNDPGAYYRGMQMLENGVTNRFSSGYLDASRKEELKSNLAKASWWSNGGTPLYDSLLEVMDNMSTAITRTSVKMIVVFSDGKPDGNFYASESSVCEKAQSMGVKIFAIGYGDASINSAAKDPQAVTVLQNLATCSNGSYMAIENINEIASRAGSLGASLTQGHINLDCKLSDPAQKLTSEDILQGTVSLHLKDVTDAKNVSFSFIPSAMAPRLMPGYESAGEACPSPVPGPTPTPTPIPPGPTPQPPPTPLFGGSRLSGGGCGAGI